jgi:hypothetical protein
MLDRTGQGKHWCGVLQQPTLMLRSLTVLLLRYRAELQRVVGPPLGVLVDSFAAAPTAARAAEGKRTGFARSAGSRGRRVCRVGAAAVLAWTMNWGAWEVAQVGGV